MNNKVERLNINLKVGEKVRNFYIKNVNYEYLENRPYRAKVEYWAGFEVREIDISTDKLLSNEDIVNALVDEVKRSNKELFNVANIELVNR